MMKWVTKRRIKVNRAATAWLIRRFIDREATLLFVEPEEVAEVQRRDGATGFDAPGPRTPTRTRGESAGLRGIPDGFPLITKDDDETVEKAAFLYDSLYAALRARLGEE
jgi:hypothetical protein